MFGEVCILLLWRLLVAAAFVGLGVMIITGPLNGFIASRLSKLQECWNLIFDYLLIF